AGGADHQDVLRRDLVAHLRRELHAPPAAAQRHRHGALGVVLADDVAVEFVDDFARGEFGHGLYSKERGTGNGEQGTAVGGLPFPAPSSPFPPQSSSILTL